MKTFTQNETSYTSKEVKIVNTTYILMQVKGKFNYINVQKVSVNSLLGKDFESFEAAIANYKNPKLKAALIEFQEELKK